MIRLDSEVSPPQIWAVEDTALQITWGRLPAGPVSARACDSAAAIDHVGGPGGIELTGLPPGTPITVTLQWDGGSVSLETATLRPPPGELLCRFATISDLHIGAFRWGALKTMTDTSAHPVPHPYRCAHAAIDEARRWGAELMIIKGDAAQHECDEHFAEVGRLVDEFADLPMLLIPGNHDVDGHQPGAIPLTIGRRNLPYTRQVDHLDLAGARVVVADTTVPGHGRGTIARVAPTILAAAASSDRPVFLATHHQLQATRFPRYWPVGISAPRSLAFLDQLNGLGRPIIVSSGHTHRNRSRRHGDVLITEVGSTKDWPGVWAGYAVHEGGVRQVIRRISRPEAIDWTEYSRQAVLGLWGRWSPGSLAQRCLSHAWVGDPSLV